MTRLAALEALTPLPATPVDQRAVLALKTLLDRYRAKRPAMVRAIEAAALRKDEDDHRRRRGPFVGSIFR